MFGVSGCPQKRGLRMICCAIWRGFMAMNRKQKADLFRLVCAEIWRARPELARCRGIPGHVVMLYGNERKLRELALLGGKQPAPLQEERSGIKL